MQVQVYQEQVQALIQIENDNEIVNMADQKLLHSNKHHAKSELNIRDKADFPTLDEAPKKKHFQKTIELKALNGKHLEEIQYIEGEFKSMDRQIIQDVYDLFLDPWSVKEVLVQVGYG